MGFLQGFKRMLGFGQQSASWRSLLPKATADAPKLYDQLQVLHIANTKLSSVPQAVTQLPNLELLSLTHCSLFVSLPCSRTRLTACDCLVEGISFAVTWLMSLPWLPKGQTNSFPLGAGVTSSKADRSALAGSAGWPLHLQAEDPGPEAELLHRDPKVPGGGRPPAAAAGHVPQPAQALRD